VLFYVCFRLGTHFVFNSTVATVYIHASLMQNYLYKKMTIWWWRPDDGGGSFVHHVQTLYVYK